MLQAYVRTLESYQPTFGELLYANTCFNSEVKSQEEWTASYSRVMVKVHEG
jgi:hypothetical protein